MHRRMTLFVLAGLVIASPAAVLAQADAKQAFELGKKVFEQGNYEAARDQFAKAAQTDVKNSEVFLWLGKAHYQLGELDEAIAAWKTTRRLAPDNAFARKMLKALRGQQLDADTAIRIIETLIEERLFAAALRDCDELLRDKALTDAQRVKVMALRAAALVETRRPADALAVVRDLLVRYPKLADPAQTGLLMGMAKLRMGGPSLPEGLATLKEVVAKHAGTPAAATAEHELLRFALQQKPDLAAAQAMEKWLEANPKHPKTTEALRQVVEGYLAVTRESGPPSADAGPSESDVAALTVAAVLYPLIARVDEARGLTHTLVAHLDQHYAKRRAYRAALALAEALLKAQLPPAGRSQVLHALARYQAELAMTLLTEQAKAGKLPAGPMPKVLADAIATYATINKEFPAKHAWGQLAALAERVRNLGGLLPSPAKVAQLKAPHAWALEIALSVVKANADTASVQKAVRTATAIVDECAKLPRPTGRKLALGVNARLLAAVSPDHAAWAPVVLKQIDLLDAHARQAFDENVRTGRADANAGLSETQKQLLAAMAGLVGREVRYAATVLGKLQSHLAAWLQHGHYQVAVDAYGQLARVLPETERRKCLLAVARVWIQQATAEHNRLLAGGLTVPRRLDPVLVKALERCYALQAGLDDRDPFGGEVRGVWDGIVSHYRALEYFDVAEQAIRTRPDAKEVPAADAYAELSLCRLHEELARRELAEALKQYDGADKIALSAAFKKAIEGYRKFISDHPDSPLVNRAVEAILGVAHLFEGHRAYDVAAGVYRDFAAFAAKVKVLSQAAPGQLSVEQRAGCAAADALLAKARRALQKQIAERAPGAEPPQKISEEFAAAVAAYKDFVKAYPGSPLLGRGIRQIMSAGLEYAKAGAWDVADAVYADLLQAGLALRRPERIEFCRGLCQLGKVIPDHARKVLEALTTLPSATPMRTPVPPPPLAGLALRSAEGKPAKTGPAGPASGTEERSLDGVARGFKAKLGRDDFAPGDALAMAAISRDRQRLASRVAALRGDLKSQVAVAKGQAQVRKDRRVVAPVLSEAEIARQEKALAAAYEIFQAIRKNHPDTPAGQQVRGEILLMIGHWRTLAQWDRAAALGRRFLIDNPADAELPQLRLAIARDSLQWAAAPIPEKLSTQEMLTEVAGRFDEARKLLAKIVTTFSKEKPIVQQAQWEIANSFLNQARVVDRFSATLARGQYVRAARELQQVAEKYHDHANIAAVPQMLSNIAAELASRGYYDEAVIVWTVLTIHYPTHSLGQQAAERIAQTYQNNLKRPLLAAEAYLELNFARGGTDAGIQSQIFAIGVGLKSEKRWVEALHVLEAFVDSFPRHANAGQALAMVGQVHQANEAWQDAIAAYRRVIDEFRNGPWVREARWSIAECTISLSRWKEATAAYRSYLAAHPKDARLKEAERRIGILKDLARYQGLVDEKGQRKAFDAQFQIAEILLTKLSNPVKAIIEYRKVAANWANSHLADDAMFKVGETYLNMGETAKARDALLAVAKNYPTSPLAGNALHMVGASYEREAQRLATVTRQRTLERAQRWAQGEAYQRFQKARGELDKDAGKRISAYNAAGDVRNAELEQARAAARQSQFGYANVNIFADQAAQDVEVLTAVQLAERRDKINAALRKAVSAYRKSAAVPMADKAAQSLLRMAVIYADQLKDPEAAMTTYLDIVRQFSGTDYAEDASWRIAQYYEKQGKHEDAIKAYEAFLTNYRGRPRAGAAQFAIAENYEQLGEWVKAMDAYTKYINNFPKGPLVQKANEQRNWIRTYRL